MSARTAFLVSVGVLVTYNIARGLGAFGGFVGLTAVGLALLFLLIARLARLGPAELGAEPAEIGNGARYGAAVLAVVAVVLVVAAVVPATRGFLDDSRGNISGPRLLFEIVVSTLVVTVIPEEIAFRGVLLATGRRMWSDGRAVLASSVLFGLWHVSPTIGSLSAHDPAPTAIATVAGTVVATFAAGLVFCWLRLRSRSLLAPVVAHLSTNGVALGVSWFVVH